MGDWVEVMPPRLAIVGPTASGKTAAAVALARRHGDIELVSVDSMAVYRYLDIGTAKPTADEREGVIWHLIDLVDPDEEFSVARFQVELRGALAEIERRGHRAVLVGGTGLYHRAAIDGLDLAGRYGEIAGGLEREAGQPGGAERLYKRLCILDPLAASKVNPTNTRRIVRALEVTLGSGRPFSSYGSGFMTYPDSGVSLVGLHIARPVLDERIAIRLDAQLDGGFVDEVDRVRSTFNTLSRTAAQALGYRELIEYLSGTKTLAEAREHILARTRRFARRQVAWFRRDPRVVWVDALGADLVDHLDAVLCGEPLKSDPTCENQGSDDRRREPQ